MHVIGGEPRGQVERQVESEGEIKPEVQCSGMGSARSLISCEDPLPLHPAHCRSLSNLAAQAPGSGQPPSPPHSLGHMSGSSTLAGSHAGIKTKTCISLPKLADFDWRVDVKTASDTVARMSVPTCILSLQVESGSERGETSQGGQTVNVELSKETLDTMLDGLSKIRDQLSSVANR